MLIRSDTDAAPAHRKQIFNDNADEDAALKKQEDDVRWVEQFIKKLAVALRRLGRSK